MTRCFGALLCILLSMFYQNWSYGGIDDSMQDWLHYRATDPNFFLQLNLDSKLTYQRALYIFDADHPQNYQSFPTDRLWVLDLSRTHFSDQELDDIFTTAKSLTILLPTSNPLPKALSKFQGSSLEFLYPIELTSKEVKMLSQLPLTSLHFRGGLSLKNPNHFALLLSPSLTELGIAGSCADLPMKQLQQSAVEKLYFYEGGNAVQHCTKLNLEKVHVLSIQGITALSVEDAEALRSFKGNLELGFTDDRSFSPEVLEHLTHLEAEYLTIVQRSQLSIDLATTFNQYQGLGLTYQDVQTVSPEVAHSFEAVTRKVLEFPSMTELPVNSAKSIFHENAYFLFAAPNLESINLELATVFSEAHVARWDFHNTQDIADDAFEKLVQDQDGRIYFSQSTDFWTARRCEILQKHIESTTGNVFDDSDALLCQK